jgi:hypothetical protein
MVTKEAVHRFKVHCGTSRENDQIFHTYNLNLTVGKTVMSPQQCEIGRQAGQQVHTPADPHSSHSREFQGARSCRPQVAPSPLIGILSQHKFCKTLQCIESELSSVTCSVLSQKCAVWLKGRTQLKELRRICEELKEK